MDSDCGDGRLNEQLRIFRNGDDFEAFNFIIVTEMFAQKTKKICQRHSENVIRPAELMIAKLSISTL